jgi:predicted NBD/HSP70 family sugar kinase
MDAVGIGIDIGGTSVKVAAVGPRGGVLWAARGEPYGRPSVRQLAAAIRTAAAGRAAGGAAVGVCVPGILDASRTTVVQSVNLPALNGTRLDSLVAEALGPGAAAGGVAVTSDAVATAFDLQESRRLPGRLFLLAIGTGVGAAVLDDGTPLRVDGDSPGHFGQIDVSVEDHPVVGPDGGAGSLEGYLNGRDLADRVETIDVDDPAMKALVRAIRIAQAIYRPHHVCLAGGVGIRLGRLVPALREAVARDLTNIARADWTLSAGDSDFHAAWGAARLALADGRA